MDHKRIDALEEALATLGQVRFRLLMDLVSLETKTRLRGYVREHIDSHPEWVALLDYLSSENPR